MPGGTARNWNSYGHKAVIDVANEDEEKVKALVCDPQTSGGLLVAVEPDAVEDLQRAARKTGTPLFEVGYLVEQTKSGAWVRVV